MAFPFVLFAYDPSRLVHLVPPAELNHLLGDPSAHDRLDLLGVLRIKLLVLIKNVPPVECQRSRKDGGTSDHCS